MPSHLPFSSAFKLASLPYVRLALKSELAHSRFRFLYPCHRSATHPTTCLRPSSIPPTPRSPSLSTIPTNTTCRIRCSPRPRHHPPFRSTPHSPSIRPHITRITQCSSSKCPRRTCRCRLITPRRRPRAPIRSGLRRWSSPRSR